MNWKLLLLLFFVFCLIYCAGMFVSWNYNPTNWHIATRAVCAVLCIVLVSSTLKGDDDENDYDDDIHTN